ncbi:unnamed protein product [Blepharisma stoltei]|uniref:Protein phosphatase methylesterase 1 n=1 Tax=Blepharisma stoltei TaxID=1481888 RepID=A0AAU9K601_9CILI|nr:unnamed protein product [Blepharisma stoltei]
MSSSDGEEEESKDTIIPLENVYSLVQDSQSLEPLLWQQFYDRLEWFGEIPIVSSGASGLVIVALHGAGGSSMTFAIIAKLLRENYHFFSFDFGCHGINRKTDEEKLDVDSLVNEALSVLNYIRQQNPDSKIIIIGHSMGGAIASKAALLYQAQGYKVSGIILIDMVEGRAFEAFSNNEARINRMPKSFDLIKDAVLWSLESQVLKNVESARISIPSQLIEINGKWEWKVDLLKTRKFWEGWFSGMNGACLAVDAPKLLIMSNSDRLDDQMTYAWHQGKIKHRIINYVGHWIHEDSPIKFVEELDRFFSMFKFK